MKIHIMVMMAALVSVAGYAGSDLPKEKRAQLEKAFKSNDTIVLATIDSMSTRGFMATYSGRPASDKGPNGAKASGILIKCKATVVKVLKGKVTTKKIEFELELSVAGSDKKRDNPFTRGSNHILIFRRKHSPIKDDTTKLGLDSWASRNWWPEDSSEGKFFLSQSRK